MLPLDDDPKTLATVRLLGDDTKGYTVRNTTGLTIRDAGVFRRVAASGRTGREPAQIEVAYIARLEPGATTSALRFAPLPPSADRDDRAWGGSTGSPGSSPTGTLRGDGLYPEQVWLAEWDNVPIFGGQQTGSSEANEDEMPRVRLEPLARLAAARLRLLPGDVRLIGWTDQRLPGMRIRPEAPQNTTYTLVLAHLVRGNLPPVRPDRNVAEDYFTPTFDDVDSLIDVPENP
jgi:hypothetical protein